LWNGISYRGEKVRKKDDEFLKRLLSTFKIEAGEHLQVISSGLTELKDCPDDEKIKKTVETIYRESHSLKGAARTVNLSDIEIICQSLEDLFAAIKNNKTPFLPEFSEPLQEAVDLIEDIISSPGEIKAAQVSDLVNRLEMTNNEASSKMKDFSPQEVLKKKKDLHADLKKKSAEEQEKKKQKISIRREQTVKFSETIRIRINRLDSLYLQAEEMLSAKLIANQNSKELQNLLEITSQWTKKWSKILPDYKDFRKFHLSENQLKTRDKTLPPTKMMIEFFDWSALHIKSLEEKLSEIIKIASGDYQATARKVDNLLEDIRSVLMLPFSTILDLFPKLVRDLSRDQGKDVDIEISGDHVEIDKRILEMM